MLTAPENIAVLDDELTRDVLSVSWDSSSICNYNCSYCMPAYNDGRNNFPPVDSVVQFLSELEVSSKKKLYLEMKGGEPTLWKHLPVFLKTCAERDWGVGLVTNGSKPIEWWHTHLPTIADVTVSLHPEFYELDTMLEKLLYINRKRPLCVFYLMIPSRFEQAKKDIQTIIDYVPNVIVQAAVVAVPEQDNKIFEYPQEQKDYIDQINSRVVPWPEHEWPLFHFQARFKGWMLTSENKVLPINQQILKLDNNNLWKGWMCNAGLDRIHIEVNGDITRGQCGQGGIIGNIHKKNWVFPTAPVLCAKERCFCGRELLLKKWDPKKVSLL